MANWQKYRKLGKKENIVGEIYLIFSNLMLTEVNSLRNTRMDRENTQSFPEDKSVQESSCIVYAQLEEISLMFVTITEFSNQTWNDQENLNESAAIENISVTKTF